MKRPLPLVHLYEGQFLRQKVNFLNWPGSDQGGYDQEKTCFKIDVDVMVAGKTLLPNYSLQLDQLNLFLVSNASGKPVKQMPLSLLRILRIIDDNP